jgi:glutathione reductase (NADPH)
MVVHGAGRVPDIEGLDLPSAGIDYELKKGIKVDEYLQSVSNPAIYAAGDAVASRGPQLTPVAAYDGEIVAANLLKGNHLKPNYKGVPSVVFTVPPLASVGLQEETAKQQGLHFKTNYDKYLWMVFITKSRGKLLWIQGVGGRRLWPNLGCSSTRVTC